MNERPTAAPARFPYAEHRNMAQVIEDERKQAGRAADKALRRYRKRIPLYKRNRAA